MEKNLHMILNDFSFSSSSFFYPQSPKQVFVLLCFDGLLKNNT